MGQKGAKAPGYKAMDPGSEAEAAKELIQAHVG